ncbi:MAG: hypothetical protein QXL94_03745, partial [Candidatus Parvarchaeum sp.]
DTRGFASQNCSARSGRGVRRPALNFHAVIIIRAGLCDKLLKKKFEQEMKGLNKKVSKEALIGLSY